ncbi:nucleotide-diphospho-sugar transferase [Hesseltinella vesiculosa]|uniref:Nucleotide-diphospho-sugar transferase n=1 Tax=Hesseltinella vesiculosa TaxID=101127 RepID=A0A1X2GR74_9FUNG|nr:nucleotide-diphospho-sugar transferase [Hesseltinella vesiculosa]
MKKHPSMEKIRAMQPEISRRSDTSIPDDTWDSLPTRGVYYMAIHNDDLGTVRETMRSMMDRSNQTPYPWVFLSNEGFTKQFIHYTTKLAQSPVFFGRMDAEAFALPPWVQTHYMEYAMHELSSNSDIYKPDSILYRQTMRYQSGLFYHHSLFQNVDYVWKMEPGISFPCQLTEDPIGKMAKMNKSIGFMLTRQSQSEIEFEDMWRHTSKYIKHYSNMTADMDQTIFRKLVFRKKYYGCQFGFLSEILDTRFLKSFQHQHFFNYLDRTSGFFYAPWTESMFRSLAAALFLDKSRLHYFNEIGVVHERGMHCPFDLNLRHQCACDLNANEDFSKGRCIVQLLQDLDPQVIVNMAQYAIHHLKDVE